LSFVMTTSTSSLSTSGTSQLADDPHPATTMTLHLCLKEILLILLVLLAATSPLDVLAPQSSSILLNPQNQYLSIIWTIHNPQHSILHMTRQQPYLKM
jgi:hypothetical protein